MIAFIKGIFFELDSQIAKMVSTLNELMLSDEKVISFRRKTL